MSKKTAVIAVAAVALVALFLCSWNTRLGREMRGIASVAVVNNGDKVLSEVELTLFRGSFDLFISVELSCKALDELAPGERKEIRVRADVLTVSTLTFRTGGETITWEGKAGVEPGQVYVLSVSSDGSVCGEFED